MKMFHPIERCKTTATCLMFGCDYAETGESRLIFESRKKNWSNNRIRREYFLGNLRYCKREGCDYEKFEGSKVPYRVTQVIDGLEYDQDPIDPGRVIGIGYPPETTEDPESLG